MLRNSSATKSSTGKRSRSGEAAAERPSMLRRYGSASSLNMINTPQRFMMTPSDATPLMSLRRTTMMSTDRGRRENHGNCVRIMEILERDSEFFAQLNLQAGLKSMTAKQFLQIITYFMHMIGGKTATTNKEYLADPLNGILKFLKLLACPYMVTKSAMKTPNAPHTFDQLVTLMMWLAEFAGIDDNELVPDESYLRDEELPNRELTATICREVEIGFGLWNKQNDDEFGQLQDRLVDAFIMAKTNNHVTSVKELNVATEASKQRIEQLNKTPSALANEQQFEAMESQYLKYEEIEHHLKQNVVRKRDQLAAIELKWNDRNETVQRKETHIKNVQMKIEAQSKNIGELKRLLDDLNVVQVSIEERKAEIEKIHGLSTANEVRSARLMSQKSKAVADYNVHVINVCRLVNCCAIGLNIDPNELSLDCQASLEGMKAIRHKINQISFAAANRRAAIEIELQKLSINVDLLRQQQQNDNNRLNLCRNEMEKITRQLKAIDMNKLNANETQCKKIADIESKLKRLQSNFRSGQKILDDIEEQVQMVRRKNGELLNKYEVEAMELLQKKQELIERLDEGIGMVDQFENQLAMCDLSDQFTGINTSSQGSVSDEQ